MPEAPFTSFTLGKYRAVELLGKGGFGTVYRAIDTTLDREVALKVLHPQLVADPTFVERFRTEAKIIAALRHPNVVGVYELGEDGGRLFIAMEYMPGGTLKERLAQRGRLSFDETLTILQQVCAGLDAAHAEGMLHRDIKPGNILFDKRGNAVVGDFGLARAMQLSSIASASSSSGGVGTPFYKAPELWRGKPPASPATDVYALTCMVYEMLTGRVLFSGDTPDEVLTKHLIDGPDFGAGWPPSDAPSGLTEVLQRGIARNPDERYTTVKELVEALSELTHDEKCKADVAESERLAHEAIARAEIERLQKEIEDKTRFEAEAKAKREAEEREHQQAESAALTKRLHLAAEEKAKHEAEEQAQPTNTVARPARRSDEVVRAGEPVLSKPESKVPAGIVLAILGTMGVLVVISLLANQPAPITPVAVTTTLKPSGMATTTMPLTATSTRMRPTITPTPGIGSKRVSTIDNMTLLYVPAGEFTMGNNSGDADEKPEHKVYLDAFWIDETEITNSAYANCVDAGICQAPIRFDSETRSTYYGDSQFANYPVIYVSWYDAETYCDWAGRRLPTEAEWEKSARDNDRRIFPWGNQKAAGNLANFCDKNCPFPQLQDSSIDDGYADTAPVGSYPAGASPYGVIDMAGNVWEWVADWHSDNYYSASPSQNPTGPDSGDRRVLRGGRWDYLAFAMRTSLRARTDPNSADSTIGFRCALSVQ